MLPATDQSQFSSEVDELLSRALEMAPVFEAEAGPNEFNGFASATTAAAMREAGFVQMLSPKRFGGADLGPRDAIRVIEALAYTDPCVSWLAASTATTCKLLRLLPEQTAANLYADGVPWLAGQTAPTGNAHKVDGGYRVSGRWSYGSGITHADYVSAAARVGEEKRVIEFFVPSAEVTIGSNWDVIGLRGTGSFDYALDDVFVPDEYVLSNYADTKLLWGTEDLPSPGWIAVAHVGWALGLGRRLLDELSELARLARGSRPRLADDPSFKRAYAMAEAKFRAAEAWVNQTWDVIQATIDSGNTVGTRELTLARTANIHLHGVLGENAVFAFTEGGGSTLRNGTLQRAVRNVFAGCQSIQLAHSMYEDLARDLLGEAEGMRWQGHRLVPAES